MSVTIPDIGPDPIAVPRVYTLHWVNIIGIGFYHLVAALAFLPYFFSWTGVILVFVGMQLFGTVGINVFYHRYLTHKGFQCPKWLEYTMAVMAVCSFQDTPAHWVAVHRRHHEFADDEPDPHTPVRSFLWAHVGWILVKSPDMSRYEIYSRYAKDVLRDPFYKLLEKRSVYLGIIVAHWFVFFLGGFGATLLAGGTGAQALQFGLSILVWGVFVRTVFNWHNTWAVNSVSHLWGYRNYETGEHSRNNIVLGLTAMGEGWHNNHHADPRSARHGHRPWEIDGTYLIIRLFALCGLAWKIREPQVPGMAGLPE
ncbi:acyl-CoA desaturase [Aquibium oceanicum]|nr:fatty acid desaturase [Aquibium oceanicum]